MLPCRSLLRVCKQTQAMKRVLATRTANTRVMVQKSNHHSQMIMLQQVRACSSSRFLSLADDEEEGKDKEDKDQDLESTAGEASEDKIGSEEDVSTPQDGDLKIEEEVDINEGGIAVLEQEEDEILALYLSDPIKWNVENLARKFHFSKSRIEAIVFLKAMENGMTKEELTKEIVLAKEKAMEIVEKKQKQQQEEEQSKEKKKQPLFLKDTKQKEEEKEEDGDDEEMAALLSEDDKEVYRNPDFFFLSDEFEGFPPLTRRLGKIAATDKLYQEEAFELQRLASQNKVTLLKSYAKPTQVKSKWRFAIKDTSKHKKPLYVRDEERSFRLATNEEVKPRSWVRRPSFFSGLEK